MDCHKILSLLTDYEKSSTKEINDEQLEEILSTVYPCISEDVLNKIQEERILISNANDTGWHYLHLILYTIKTLCDVGLNEESPLFTVDQLKAIKIAIEIAASIGIIPSLLPQIKIHATTSRSRNFKLILDNDSIFEKYKKICYTVNTLLESFNISILRPALISQLDCLLAALLQLSHAPLKKPTVPTSTCNALSIDFDMTPELYTQLKTEQENFRQKLQNLIEDCPQSFLIKELMVIMGIKSNPKWLIMNIKNYLTDRIIQPNGIISLTMAVCDEVSDLGKCWDKLDVTARLVATSCGLDKEKYYDSISSQILEMLNDNNNKQGVLVANCCIKALYDYNSDICTRKITDIIMEPFLVKRISEKYSNLIKTEEEVSQCIENLCKLFIITDAEFKCLPTKLLTLVAVPIFYLHIKSYKSIYAFRNQAKQLLLKILANEPTRETIFSIFLNHKISENEIYGKKLNFRFGVNGGLEITSDPLSIEYEELTDCLFNLVEKDGKLSFSLFTYVLKVLPELNSIEQKVQRGTLLETTTDTLERIEKQITAVKLLTLLSSLTQVQEAQTKNPLPLLDFIKFFFSKILASSESDNSYEQDTINLYTGLMLVKMIITDGNITHSWKTFQDFITSVRTEFDFKKVPEHVVSIIEEIETLVKEKKSSNSKNYYDLSADNTKLSEFDKALNDLADPLLPVRAHGIIALTKLIERRHPEVSSRQDFLLCIFQENLNDEDSFIYLAAINGLCAMSTIFPDKVIEILIQEFIGMTQETGNRDVPPETRAKLGEILVKTTRALGEITPKYKNLMVNGFLSGTRDPDPMVRASSLSCLGEFCKIMGFRLGNLIIEILYCIGCIIKTDKDDGCRRAGVLVATLLLRGLGKDALTELGENLVPLYRSLKHLRDNDKDSVLQLHAQLALEEFNDIVQQFLFTKPKLQKSIFLLSN